MDSPESGYWPNPNIEAFRRPQRTNQEIHLNLPDSIKSVRVIGDKIYIQDLEEGSFLFSKCTEDLTLKNRFDCFNNSDEHDNKNFVYDEVCED